ncbi:TetR/AcrR family transcriptional regulator [Streptomyces bohaiensis]|uniref:TetR/AcrR family transcriptional regulator n=1 Tax=Streptomyces bohaiensis TaxID=1431344 RepID=A0ABX1CE96_9ACTN|nr:TetR/AcrR family transcriptional regulator [Streptomyces bohaiensis]NJQ15517.1 TetR/AcrR family transcriptional regulator [Streptomyces bohaiensis]
MAESAGVRREQARRTREGVLEAAAAVFVAQGVQAPVREIAHRAEVGVGTVYRHFPTRADLVTAVYRHQIDACAELAPRLLAACDTPSTALHRWTGAFVDFLVTKHGLGAALGSEDPGLENLHAVMVDTLVPACAELLGACVDAGEVRADVTAYTLMRAVGNLCITGPDYDQADARRMVDLLLTGCRTTS